MMPDFDIKLIIPELFLFLFALFIIAFDLGTRRRHPKLIGWLAMGGTAFSGLLLYIFYGGSSFNDMYLSDSLSLFFKMIFLGSAFMAIGSSFDILTNKIKNHRGEFLGLILLSTVGMMFLSSAGELIQLYVGLELTTIPLFILVAYYKDDRVSVEAGLKYLIVGAFSSGILLYGLSILYGLTGTTNLNDIIINLAQIYINSNGQIGLGLIFAMVLILAGFGFKLALVPFHMWAPDVYQGAPTPITALLSVGSKAAGLVAFIRLVAKGFNGFAGFPDSPYDWTTLLLILAAAAMVLGNLTALKQHNIKRMLAYSSIAHIGYAMVGILAISELGIASVSFYMFTYLFANMGAFAAATFFSDKTGSDSIDSYSGLSKTSPFISASMTIFLLSLAGIPPLAGFAAKYMVFAAGIKAGYTWLVLLALLTSVVSLYYYAGVMKKMYFTPGDSSTVKIDLTLSSGLVLALGIAGLIIFGIFPGAIMNFAKDAASVIPFFTP